VIRLYFIYEELKMTKNHKLPVIVSILLLSALACARTFSLDPTPSPTSLPTGETTHTLTHDTLERSYILYVPSSVNWHEPIALVFVFHGGTGNAESAIRMSGFNEVADQNGFVVVYPNGTGRLSDDKLLTWNGGACCGYAQEKNVDDVGFVRAIVTDLQSLATVNTRRIYATGLSNGGILSQRVACEAPDLFAAIAPVAGTLNLPACKPSQPISVIEFHGTEDENIPYNGGKGPKSLVNVDFASVPDSIAFWTAFNGCKAQSQMNSFADIQHETWRGCSSSTAVELYTIVGGGHAWPGGVGGWAGSDQPIQTISASQVIWEFFAAHPKP
jgi:polyhydroxybutyrate depolymerase